MKVKYSTSIYGARLIASMLSIVSLLVACSLNPDSRVANEERVKVTALVDGAIEIIFSVPHPADNRWTTKTLFVQSDPNKLTNIFITSYDPGQGRMAGTFMVHMTASVLRIETENGKRQPINFKDIMQIVYLSHPEKKGEYRIAGSVFIGKEEWYKVRYTGRFPSSTVSYYKPIFDNYALLISMNMYGDNSDKSELFKQRHEDLLKVLDTVMVTVADFVK